jgi:ribosomal protein S18 acetylase RimI-like enzyme
MLRIRSFDPARDRRAIRACFIELQDFERRLEPRMPVGEQVADAYLELMFRRCRLFDGSVFVADVDGTVVGFVTVWARYRSAEPDDDPGERGYVSDLVVSEVHRRRGIGRALLRAAEARAREAGVCTLRLSVKAGNTGARSLYAAEGFEASEIHLEKKLP